MTSDKLETPEEISTDVESSNPTRPPAAAVIRKALAKAAIPAIRITGHPGSGKTSLIEATLRHLPAPMRVGVIVINPASIRDAQRLRELCGYVGRLDVAVPTGAGVGRVFAEIDLQKLDLLLIETAGGLAPLHDLGQDAIVSVFAVSGGDDKAAEYRQVLAASSAVILTKKDLLPLVKFDSRVFRNDLESINPAAEIFEISAQTGIGIPAWVAWLDRLRACKRRKQAGPCPDAASNQFLG